jgi:hypothetical protein
MTNLPGSPAMGMHGSSLLMIMEPRLDALASCRFMSACIGPFQCLCQGFGGLREVW